MYTFFLLQRKHISPEPLQDLTFNEWFNTVCHNNSFFSTSDIVPLILTDLLANISSQDSLHKSSELLLVDII